MNKVIVVGGGAAGMMAAVSAAAAGCRVTLIEKNEKLGKKLFITGKGRCNITNNCSDEVFFESIVSNHKFLYSAYSGFNSGAVQDFFVENGLRVKEERGRRIFPLSDRSADVIGVFKRLLRRYGVEVLLNTLVREIGVGDGDEVTGVLLNNGGFLSGKKVIIATGGLSYPATGSTGDGYRFALAFGHRVNRALPALVPLCIKEEWCQRLQGLAIKNAGLVMKRGKKVIYQGFGEMLFTHFGLSGPVILSASSYYVKLFSKEAEEFGCGCEGFRLPEAEVLIDLKPGLSFEQLDRRLLRDFEVSKGRLFKNILGGLLPLKMHEVFMELNGFLPEKKVSEISKEERRGIVSLLKGLKLTAGGVRGFGEAIITQGGVDVHGLSPGTMESKRVKGLYFAGEVLDVDGLTGGFNLQVAWCTGAAAGVNSVI